MSNELLPPIVAQSKGLSTGQKELLAIVVLLFLPFIAGALLYSSGWRPNKTSNRGEFVQPLTTINHQLLQQSRWTLVLLHDAPCGDLCVQKLDGLRRVRAALAKEFARTRHAWLGVSINSEGQQIVVNQPDLLLIEQSLSSLVPNSERFAKGEIIIVDPRGRVVLRYKADADLKDIRSDLEKLLKTSWAT